MDGIRVGERSVSAERLAWWFRLPLRSAHPARLEFIQRRESFLCGLGPENAFDDTSRGNAAPWDESKEWAEVASRRKPAEIQARDAGLKIIIEDRKPILRHQLRPKAGSGDAGYSRKVNSIASREDNVINI